MGEHVEAGSVDEVDLGVLPFGESDGVGHGGAARDFFFVVHGDGGTVFDAALGGGHLGGMQQSGDQCGLAAVRMPHYSYVADLTSLVRFHFYPRFGVERWGYELRSQVSGSRRGAPTERWRGSGIAEIQVL